ncbi:MAG TPA: hypothetical protein DCL48_06535, partial [Alphaproteobacteria bacterium]|nr:hypothetical protein [Alphaproteobacteria bacterium]
MLVGIDGHREFLGKLGLLNRVAFELPEAGAPQAPRRWSHLHSMTISYGHGVAVNAVQLSAAAAAMVNGGRLHRPSVLRKPAGQTAGGEQVISERTSAQIRDLLRAVVTKGTGKQA